MQSAQTPWPVGHPPPGPHLFKTITTSPSVHITTYCAPRRTCPAGQQEKPGRKRVLGSPASYQKPSTALAMTRECSPFPTTIPWPPQSQPLIHSPLAVSEPTTHSAHSPFVTLLYPSDTKEIVLSSVLRKDFSDRAHRSESPLVRNSPAKAPPVRLEEEVRQEEAQQAEYRHNLDGDALCSSWLDLGQCLTGRRALLVRGCGGLSLLETAGELFFE